MQSCLAHSTSSLTTKSQSLSRPSTISANSRKLGMLGCATTSSECCSSTVLTKIGWIDQLSQSTSITKTCAALMELNVSQIGSTHTWITAGTASTPASIASRDSRLWSIRERTLTGSSTQEHLQRSKCSFFMEAMVTALLSVSFTLPLVHTLSIRARMYRNQRNGMISSKPGQHFLA